MRDFYNCLKERGFVHQTTFADDVPQFTGLYIGFDATASSLHVGSLIQLMVLRWAQAFKVPAYALIGDFTTRIGDPTGRSTARPVLTREEILKNCQGIRNTISKIAEVDFISNGADIYGDMGVGDFLSLTTTVSLNRMLTLDSVKSRLDRWQPMTLMEALYPVIQGNDFAHLYGSHHINLQVGGSDQWGNITMGTDMIRRKGGSAYGLTTPLLVDRAGNKMGKSLGKPVWLDGETTTPLEFYQYWLNCDDDDVSQFLHLFTMESLQRIHCISGYDIREQKKVLAELVTGIVHGSDIAERCVRESEAMFSGQGGVAVAFVEGMTVIDLIAQHGNSRKQARRLIASCAVKVDGAVIDADQVLRKGSVVQVGKRIPWELVA